MIIVKTKAESLIVPYAYKTKSICWMSSFKPFSLVQAMFYQYN